MNWYLRSLCLEILAFFHKLKMRFVSQSAVAALLAARVLGHPAPLASSSSQGIQRRAVVDLTAYRLAVGANYTNNVVVSDQSPSFRTFSAPTYTDVARSFVATIFPDAEYRLVSNYKSSNGLGHVVFKQTVHGIDIDTADFNVNVSSLRDR